MSERVKRVNELIRELVSSAIAQNIDKKYLPTVTAVETSRDLKSALVWVSVLKDEEGFVDQLRKEKNKIQHEVTSKMYTKYTPILTFQIDHSGEHAQRIEELLNGN